MNSGDFVYLAAARSKADFARVMYSPFPSKLAFRSAEPTNAAHALCILEVANPWNSTERATQGGGSQLTPFWPHTTFKDP
eukprot:6191045-Pleurochrysis_carterae.AAC.6